MRPPSYQRATFTIASNAKRKIALLRQVFDATSRADPAAVTAIAWALVMPKEGPDYEQMMVSFFTRSQLPSVVNLVQTVSNMDVVLLATREGARHFEGRILDFSNSDGFFLRRPPPALTLVADDR